MTKILVGILAYNRQVDVDLMKTLLFIERTNKYHLDYLFPISSHLARNRNYVVTEALKGDYDAVLFLDADMSIPDETFLDKMIECGFKYDSKVIGGAYRMKKGDEYILIAGTKDKDGKLDNIREKPKGAMLVEGLGTGCMLIYREVLQKVDDPHFQIIDKPRLEVEPEDFGFVRKALEKGFKAVLCPHFETRHWGSRAWIFEP